MESARPAVRTFYRLRHALVEALGVDCQAVRPSTRLEALIPAGRRRAVWKHLHRRGLALPDLCLPPRVAGLAVTGVALGAILLGAWLQNLLALLAIFRLGFAAWLVTRPFAAHVRYGPVTVWDAALYLTPFKGNESYAWGREEIATKVRLIISEGLGVRLEDVRPESRLGEDLGCC